MEPVIPRRKKVPVIHNFDVHKEVTEPIIQRRKKEDRSTSPIKYKNEPEFQNKKKFADIYKNKETTEQEEKSNKFMVQKNKDKSNGKDENLLAWNPRRRSKSAHNIGKSHRHHEKNNANMPPAGCITNNPEFGEYILLHNKIPYRLKPSNLSGQMNNSSIQDLYRPAFANNSDFIILKNNVPYHLKKHSHLINKNDETADWWNNFNGYEAPVKNSLESHNNHIYNKKPTETTLHSNNVPKYRRSHSQENINYRNKLLKDEIPNKQVKLIEDGVKHSDHTHAVDDVKNDQLNLHHENSRVRKQSADYTKQLKSPNNVNIQNMNAVEKPSIIAHTASKQQDIKNINKSEKNLVLTKSAIGKYVTDKHEERKMRLKNMNAELENTSNKNRLKNGGNNNITNEAENSSTLKVEDLKNSSNYLPFKNVEHNYRQQKEHSATNPSKYQRNKLYYSEPKQKINLTNRADDPRRMSEYQRQFQWLSNYSAAPVAKAQNLLHLSQPDLSQYGKLIDKNKTDKKTSLTVNNIDREVKVARSLSTSPNRPSSAPKLFRSEYSNSYNPPDKFDYKGGHWHQPNYLPNNLNGSVSERAIASNSAKTWFDQVVELRQRADEYRSRGQGVHFSRDHLGQLMARNLEMWAGDSSAPTTHRSDILVSARTHSNSTQVPTYRSEVINNSLYDAKSERPISERSSRNSKEQGNGTIATQTTLRHTGALANDTLIRAQMRNDNFWSGT